MQKIIIAGQQQKDMAKRLIDDLPLGAKFEVRIQKAVKGGTYEQMKLLRKMTKELGDELGYDQQDMHDIINMKMMQPRVVEFNGMKSTVYKSWADLNRQERTELIDAIYRWALDLGIILEMPLDKEFA